MKLRSIFLWLGGLLATAVLLIGVLLLALWLWTANDSSLATALRQASRYLPAGQVLVAEGVRGTLRQGGHIDLLRWQNNGMVVEARQVDLVWQPRALLDRRLQLDTLHVAQLSIENQGTSSQAAPLEKLVLPFQVDLTFVIDTLQVAGSAALQVTQLAGRYQFDDKRHTLKLDSAQLAAGQYRAQASLLAAAPMTLDVQVEGDVQAPLPGKAQPLPLAATASVRGNLAGADALLEVQAVMKPAALPRPAPGPRAAKTPPPMQATLAAHIKPWAPQPIVTADAAFSNLNLATLWPDAPQTGLTGSATVQPDTASPNATLQPSWQVQGHFTNHLSGPWNLHQLPVDSAQAHLSFSHGQWQIQSLTADIASGRLAVQGQLKGVSGWQAQAMLNNINPAAIHTQLAAARIDGQVNATATPQGIEFDTRLQPAAKQPEASRLQGLRLKSAVAKGRWAEGTLSLQTLDIQTSDAALQGRIDVHLASKATRGQLALSLPGGQAQAHGQMSAQAGAGEFSFKVSNASQASRWLETLPGADKLLAGHAVQGKGDLTGSWQGGWQSANLMLRSQLRIPQLDWMTPKQTPAQAMGVRELQAELSGRLSKLLLKVGGQVQSGSNRFDLQAQATGGRNPKGDWQAVVNTARLQAQNQQQAGLWTVQIRQPLSIALKNTATGSVLETSAGEAALTGPSPGAAAIIWNPVRWSRSGTHQALKTQGQLKGIPLGWLELLGSTPLTKMGLRGDLVFDGEWDVLAADTLKASVSLVRRSGDIRVQLEGETGAGVSAGVKDARLTLKADGDVMRVSARWDSLRAGMAQGDFSTRITSGADGWRWPADAPLTGTLQAQLPQVGVWSVLAPPGWRIRGTLDANIALSGTRIAPQWRGTLNADSLALRSIAEGIEFSNGKLRTTLNGQRLDINEFSLQGATGAGGSGGLLNAKGFAQWLPDGTGATASLSKINIELNMQAQALRVSARADRRLAVSGNLEVKLGEAKLEVRGALKADQALFILPDESTPRLGEDVVVRSSNKNPTSPTSPVDATPPAANGHRLVPDVSVTLEMGPDFRVQGRGLSTRLTGTLMLLSSAATGNTPRLLGNLSTVRGSYKAYGQLLDIEEGVLRFTGPYDNPVLDILAIRPNLTVRVGVQITGTALLPRVRLYADPELPEAEKLAWLVLGRSAANGGAEAAVLQQAAMALLGGNGRGLSGGLSQALGLDELSFRGAASNADGTTTGAAVTLGKRLSSNFYVAYERSMAGTLGTVHIFYELSRRFSLRAQTGEQSTIDLIFTLPYD
ncbi:MAG: translocation/assembly module TamB domain-containing protein [Pseudomonadota bacterium]